MSPDSTVPILSNSPSRWRFATIALAVAFAHGAVLYAAPQTADPSPTPWRFFTATVHGTPAIAPPDPQLEAPTTTRAAAPRQRRPTEFSARKSAPEHTDQAQKAIVFIAETASLPAPTPDPLVAQEQPILQVAMAATEKDPALPMQTSASDSPAPAPTPRVVLPPPARLHYDVKGEVKGFPYQVQGELLWATDQKTYHARLEMRHFLLGSRVQTSTGSVGPQGLEPTRFGDKVKSEVAAHFVRDKGKISFSANTPDAPLLAGAQDQLSVLIQVAGLVAAQGERLGSGAVFPFQAVGPRSAETWKFTVAGIENLTLPGGAVQALRLWRDPVGEYDPKLEIWLAPAQGYLPVRIRLTQRNGDFVDQQWRETAQP